MKTFIFFLFLSSFSFAYAQNEMSNTAINLSAGKFFSNYRYYKYYDGLESINLSLSHKISNRFGASINQNYGRMFNERINNRAKVFHTNIVFFAIPFQFKKTEIKVSLGTGLTQIYNKCLYESYPFKEHIFGSNVNARLDILYHLNQKMALSLSYDADYSYLFFNNNNYIPQDPYYYKTYFGAVNLGISYYLHKKAE